MLNTGNIVKVRYRDTIGELGNGAYKFSKGSAVQGYSNVTITTLYSAAEGSERETNDSIKFNSTRFFTTQERAVTAADYSNLTKAKFPQLQSVVAYGGEELIPPQYGKVGISVKPYGSAGLISNSLKTEIVNYLNSKSITTQAIMIDPEYFYIKVDSLINYNSSITSNSPAQVSSLVQTAIINYGTTHLTDFGSDLRYSKLISAIDLSESSIISNDTNLKIIKRWSPTVGTLSSTSFSFNNPLHAETKLYSLPQGHAYTVYSSNFSYTTADGTVYSSFFADDGLGIINIYTNVTTDSGVNRLALSNQVGTVDYSTGTIAISADITAYSGSYISIYARLENSDIYSNINKFLLIDAIDVSITLNPVTV
jgi:hypothetical protein